MDVVRYSVLALSLLSFAAGSSIATGQVLIQGSTLNAGQQLVVNGGDVQVLDQKEIDYEKKVTRQSSLLSSSSKGRIHRDELIAASQLASDEDLSLLSSGDVTLLGSELVSGGDLNL